MVPSSVHAQSTERYGRYLLLERIGEGGMADCFRAVVQGAGGFQRLVVLKRIKTEHATRGDFMRMFVREARVSALLHHPNIVQVFDFGEHQGTYFLVMEHVHGCSLLELLRALYKNGQALAPGTAAYIAEQVAQGLAYAHGLTDQRGRPRGIVHRDITPSNIMLPFTGGVKIVDFGIAKALDEPDNVGTRSGDLKGKLSYMAPEQVTGEPVDHQADVFSLGVVLWEMLVGRRLFTGKTDFDVLKGLVESPIPLPSSRREDLPPELDVIVVRAMSRNKAFRYATAAELAEDLAGFLHATNHRPGEIGALLRQHFPERLSQEPDDALGQEDTDAIPISDSMIEDDTPRIDTSGGATMAARSPAAAAPAVVRHPAGSGKVIQEVARNNSSGVTVLREGTRYSRSPKRRR